MESPHGELGARFTNGLSSDDAHRQTALGQLPPCQVHAIATGADPERSLACQGVSHTDALVAQGLNALGDLLGDGLAIANHHFVVDHIDDRVPSHPSTDALRQRNRHAVTLVNDGLGAAAHGAAVVHGDNHVLGHISQLASQVACVSGLEGSISQSLTGTVGRGEVLQHPEALTEVGLDGRLDDLARRLGHQAAHAAQLTNLVHGTTRTRVHHAPDRVYIACLLVEVLGQHSHQVEADLLPGVSPQVDDLEVTLALSNHTPVVGLFNLVDLVLGLFQHNRLGVGDTDIAAGKRQARASRGLEAQVLEVVQQCQS